MPRSKFAAKRRAAPRAVGAPQPISNNILNVRPMMAPVGLTDNLIPHSSTFGTEHLMKMARVPMFEACDDREEVTSSALPSLSNTPFCPLFEQKVPANIDEREFIVTTEYLVLVCLDRETVSVAPWSAFRAATQLTGCMIETPDARNIAADILVAKGLRPQPMDLNPQQEDVVKNRRGLRILVQERMQALGLDLESPVRTCQQVHGSKGSADVVAAIPNRPGVPTIGELTALAGEAAPGSAAAGTNAATGGGGTGAGQEGATEDDYAQDAELNLSTKRITVEHWTAEKLRGKSFSAILDAVLVRLLYSGLHGFAVARNVDAVIDATTAIYHGVSQTEMHAMMCLVLIALAKRPSTTSEGNNQFFTKYMTTRNSAMIGMVSNDMVQVTNLLTRTVTRAAAERLGLDTTSGPALQRQIVNVLNRKYPAPAVDKIATTTLRLLHFSQMTALAAISEFCAAGRGRALEVPEMAPELARWTRAMELLSRGPQGRLSSLAKLLQHTGHEAASPSEFPTIIYVAKTWLVKHNARWGQVQISLDGRNALAAQKAEEVLACMDRNDPRTLAITVPAEAEAVDTDDEDEHQGEDHA